MTPESTRTIQVLDSKGSSVRNLSLPGIFNTIVREDIIRKAVIAEQSHRFQPQGRDLMAGKRTTAESFGVGRGISRVPRIGGHGPLSGTAAFAPGTVSGRMAFPPVIGKRTSKWINRKERRVALSAAIAATASTNLVRKRGHKFGDTLELPLVVTDELGTLSKASEARLFLTSLGLGDDIARVGKSRRLKKSGRRVHAVGPLVVVGEDQRLTRKAFGNFKGVDVVRVKDLSVEILAPGTHPGRLTVWTESAVKTISGWSR